MMICSCGIDSNRQMMYITYASICIRTISYESNTTWYIALDISCALKVTKSLGLAEKICKVLQRYTLH